MVEFYFGQLVEYVRNTGAAPWEVEGQDDDDFSDDNQVTDDRRAAGREDPPNFCPEGCYWRCEHR